MRPILSGALALGIVVLVAIVRPWETRTRHGEQNGGLRAQTGETLTVTLPVEGMTCASCVASVKRAAESVEGVRNAEVDLATRRARVQYVADKTSPEEIAKAIAQRGYKTGTPAVERGR